MKTYELGERDGARFIRCLICRMESFNSNDIAQRYCGFCHHFHDTIEACGLGRVWLSQWLCPRRHCAVAFVWDPQTTNARTIQNKGEEIFKSGAINRRCGICGGELFVEHRPTIYSDKEQAERDFREVELQNLATRAALNPDRNKN